MKSREDEMTIDPDELAKWLEKELFIHGYKGDFSFYPEEWLMIIRGLKLLAHKDRTGKVIHEQTS